MLGILYVMLGGAVGSAARLLVGRAMAVWLGAGYPWGTLTVNIVGGFLMGVLAGSLARMSVPGENVRLLLGVGVLGGFTTFSSFSLDFVTLVERGQTAAALGYAVLSFAGAIAALWSGLMLVRAVA